MEHRRKKLTMYLIEVKQGCDAIRTRESTKKEKVSPGLKKHQQDFYKLQNEKSLIKEQFFNKKRNINESVRQERFQYEALVEKIDKDKTDIINKFRPLCNQKHNELYNLTLKRGKLENFNPLKKEIDELKDKEKRLMSKVKDIEIQIKELNINADNPNDTAKLMKFMFDGIA